MEHLRQLRKEKGLTQEKLAGILKVSRAAYNSYELGTREPDHFVLIAIADYFNVSTDYLLGRTDIRRPVTSGSFVIPPALEGSGLALTAGDENLDREDLAALAALVEYMKRKNAPAPETPSLPHE